MPSNTPENDLPKEQNQEGFFSSFGKFVGGAVDGVKGVVVGTVDAVGEAGNDFAKGFQNSGSTSQSSSAQGVNEAQPETPQIVSDIGNGLSNVGSKLSEGVSSIFSGLKSVAGNVVEMEQPPAPVVQSSSYVSVQQPVVADAQPTSAGVAGKLSARKKAPQVSPQNTFAPGKM